MRERGLFAICIFMKTIEDRFWSKVEKSETCWAWTACRLSASGYGRFGFRGKTYYAHRVSWIFAFGELSANEFVLHHCDTPSCVRPSHLFTGSQQENMLDKVRKGRQTHGASHGPSKLTVDQVLEIRSLYASGAYTQDQLGRRFGTTQPCISRIVRRKAWRHE